MSESTLADLGGSPSTADAGPLDAVPSTSAPETPSPASPDPATDAGAPDTTPTDGRPRGPDGRFAPRTGDAPASAPIDPAAPASTPQSPLPPVTAQPFSFRSNGQRVPLEGATYEPGKGLTVPEAALPGLKSLLQQGHLYRTVGQQREAQYRQELQQARQELETRQGSEDAELKVYKDWFLEIIGDPTGARLLQAVEQFKGESALLSERAERAKLQKQLEARTATQAPAPNVEQQQQQLVAGLTKGASDYLEDLKDDGTFGLLNEADWADLMEMVKETPGALLAEQDGQYVLDTQPIRRAAERIKRVRSESVTQAKALTTATEYNAKRATAPPPAPVPPKPRATAPAAESGDKWERQQRWERDMGLR